MRTNREGNPYRLQASYRYEVNGQRYNSEQVYIEPQHHDDYQPLGKLAHSYSPGSEATCYVNPADPQQSVLQHRLPMVFLFLPLPGIFILVGGGGVAAALFGTFGKEEEEERSIAAKSKKGKGALVGAGFLGLFGVAGLGAFVAIFGVSLVKLGLAQTWPEVKAKVVGSYLQEHEGDDSTNYKADILYEYVWEDEVFRNNNYNFLNLAGSYDGAKAVRQRYPAGSKVTVRVNPSAPYEAVLHPRLSLGYLVGLIPLVIGAAFSVGAYYVWRGDRKEATEAEAEADARPRAERAARVLKPRTGPIGKFIGILCVALFWNGIVGVFAYQVIDDLRNGRFEVCMVLFLVPFVLVGLGLIGAVGYQFLALFNPSVPLRLDPGELYVGETAELRFQVRGNYQRFQQLVVTLRGVEEATYRRGTDTVTQTNNFLERELMNTSDHREMRKGIMQVELPQETMHTWSAKNNKIRWELHVHGDIKSWPDVDVAYDFTVHPEPLHGD